MSLHPQARALLDLIAASDPTEPSDDQLAENRAGFGLLVAMGAGPAEPVAAVRDLDVTGPAGVVPVRVYRPEGSDTDAALPVVFYFHGGGWTIGSVAEFDGITRQVANRSGAVVVAVDYRLAPEHPYPAAIDDCWAATTWVLAHATDVGVDPARFALMGDSAGGNLAAVLAQRCAREGGPQPALQVLVYPVTDAAMDTPSYRENGEGYLLERARMRWFFDCYLRGATVDREDPTVSPLRATDLRGVAPALVITAEFDPLRDEGEAYAAALRAAGVPVTQTRYDGMIHAFFGLGAALDAGHDAVTETGAALRGAFGTL